MSHAPGAPKTMRPVAEDIVRSPDAAWKSALYDSLRSADGFHEQSVDGTMKIVGVCWRDAGTPMTAGAHSRTTQTMIRAC